MKIRKGKYLLIAFLLLLGSCNDSNISTNIQQQDIDFVHSLKKTNIKDHIISIDSAINITNKKEERLALLYLKKGKLQSKTLAYSEATENYEKALTVFKKIEAKKYITETYFGLGSANAFLLKKVIANEQLLKALELSKEIDDKKTEANVYGSLAYVYFSYSDYLTSIAYVEKAIIIRETTEDTIGLSSSYNNLAVIYKNIGKFEKALEYNTKSLALNIQQNDTISIAKSYNNIGNVYSKTLSDDKIAIKYFLLAIDLNEKKGLLNSHPLENLGDIYFRKPNIKQAKHYYLKALSIENKKNSTSKKLELNNILLQISLEERNLEKAIFYQQKRDSLNNSQIKKDTQEKLDLVENQYQLAISKQNLIQQQKLNKKNQIIFLIIIGILLLLALLWFQYEKNKKLKYNEEKNSLELKVLRSQMNPHFIFNVLSSIQNYILDNDQITSAKYLSKFAKLIRQNFDFTNHKTITLSDELDALKNYLDTQQMRFENKFEYLMTVSENIDINIVEIPPLLLQPFIENAIEHGFKAKKEKGLITLNISKKNNKLCFEINDNGKGITPSKHKTKTHSTDIFIKRLKLLGNKDEQSFIINTSSKGTNIIFSLIQ